MKSYDSTTAYLVWTYFKIPLREVAYWKRGSFARPERHNEFDLHCRGWNFFKKQEGIDQTFLCKEGKPISTPMSEQSLIYRNNNIDGNLDVFYVTDGMPIGLAPYDVRALFERMREYNVACPISVTNKRIVLREKNV